MTIHDVVKEFPLRLTEDGFVISCRWATCTNCKFAKYCRENFGIFTPEEVAQYPELLI